MMKKVALAASMVLSVSSAFASDVWLPTNTITKIVPRSNFLVINLAQEFYDECRNVAGDQVALRFDTPEPDRQDYATEKDYAAAHASYLLQVVNIEAVFTGYATGNNVTIITNGCYYADTGNPGPWPNVARVVVK